jgi:hypothetical protein
MSPVMVKSPTITKFTKDSQNLLTKTRVSSRLSEELSGIAD